MNQRTSYSLPARVVSMMAGALAICLASPAAVRAGTPLLTASYYAYPASDFLYAVVAGDLNGDGRTDAALAGYNSNTIDVLFGQADGTFGVVVTYPVTLHPYSLKMGDLNGDGRPDLVVGCGLDSICVLINSGGGVFAAAARYATPPPIPTNEGWQVSVALGDLNHDGRPDIVSGNKEGRSFSVFLNSGTGAFPTRTDIAIVPQPSSEVIGDLNGDGNMDVFVNGDAPSFVYLGKGDGTFVQPPIQMPLGVGAGEFADVNEDGKLDAVGAGGYCLGNGDGTLGACVSFTPPSGLQPNSFDIGDLNGDGHVDVVAAGSGAITVYYGDGAGGFSSSPTFTFSSYSKDIAIAREAPGGRMCAYVAASNHLEVHAATPDGSFPNPLGVYPASAGVYEMVVADLNGDSRPDLVVAGASFYGKINTLLNNGTLTMGTLAKYFVGGPTAQSVAAGDLTGDGKLDIVFTSQGTYPSTPPAVSATINQGDGTFGPTTNVPVGFNLNGSTLGTVALGDFSGDGKQDLAVSANMPPGISILLGDGHGGFGSRTVVGSEPGSLYTGLFRVADVNGDGHLDLVQLVKSGLPQALAVFLGDGAGGFGPETDTQVFGGFNGFELADLNLDGHVDAVVYGGFATITLLGTGSGTFGTRRDYGGTGAVRIADIDGDGKPDVVVPQAFVVSVLRGNGDGSLQPSFMDYGGGGSMLSPPIDLNGDSAPEMLALAPLTALLTVFPNTKGTRLSVPNPSPARPGLGVALAASPNPAHSGSMLRWVLPTASHVSLRVYDVTGRLVQTLQNGPASAGEHESAWNLESRDGARVKPGIYFADLRAPGARRTLRIAIAE